MNEEDGHLSKSMSRIQTCLSCLDRIDIEGGTGWVNTNCFESPWMILEM